MSNYDLWDDENIESDIELEKPFFEVADKDDETILRWLDDNFARRVKAADNRLREYGENVAYFKGQQYRDQFSDRMKSDGQLDYTKATKDIKIVDNLVWETIEEKIAQMIRYRPAITALPANSEWDDDNAAKSVKQMIDTRWYDVGIDRLFTRDQFFTFLYGSSIIHPYWDEEEGPNKSGDVSYKIIYPERFFPEEKETWDEVDNVFVADFMCPYELSKLYPDAEINPERLANTGSDEVRSQHFNKKKNKVLVRTFWHRDTKFLDEGVKIVSINGKLLKKEPFKRLKNQDGKTKLPFVLHVDIEEDKSFWGRSYIRLIKQAQDQYNGNSSSIARSFAYASVPKWFVPWGACDIKTITNGHTIIKYKGSIEPRLATFQAVSKDIYEQQDRLKATIDRKSKVYNIYRRDQKIDLSGIALQFLDEQESESVSVTIQRRAQVFLDVGQFTIDLMSEYYKEGDERFSKIFGIDDTYVIDQFDISVLGSKYSIRLQNSPALPQHKSSRIQLMLDVNAKVPDVVQRETFIDLLDLANSPRYLDMITVASRSASWENDQMVKLESIPEPKEWENHLVHYESHVKKLEERKFKKNSSPEIEFAFQSHIMATEMLMWDKARKNPMFRQKLMMIDYFPIFFSLPEQEVELINRMSMGGSLGDVEAKNQEKAMQEATLQPVVQEPIMGPETAGLENIEE